MTLFLRVVYHRTGKGGTQSRKEAAMIHLRNSAARAALIGAMVVLSLVGPAFAQRDPCAENGPDCRLLTPAEVSALKARFLALEALLPVPDPARWAVPPGLSKAMTMDFVSEFRGRRGHDLRVVAGRGFRRNATASAPCMTAWSNPYRKRRIPRIPWRRSSRCRLRSGTVSKSLAELLPHAYLVDRIGGAARRGHRAPTPPTSRRPPTFLSWMSREGTNLTMIFGPRTDQGSGDPEGRQARRNRSLPSKCITLEISRSQPGRGPGPEEEGRPQGLRGAPRPRDEVT
ncbi:MAG: hypothetical protein MZU91_10770 [Desulfosudis oleivorans]|nr:hypothetical protein [Desulfosudis oleivorans]